MKIYLDNAATTRPNVDAVQRAFSALGDDYFNPSALYLEGVVMHNAIRSARKTLLEAVADPFLYDLIFTSGGTEADNHALFGLCRRGNVIISQGEHAAVYESAMELKRRGADVRLAPLRADGSVDPEKLLALVDDRTSLVSVVHVNNETGAVNDIEALSSQVKERNEHTLFHSDGVQAYGKIAFRLPRSVDAYSISAHKIGGAKGTGALIRKKNIRLLPYLFGGGQEGGMRSGTENVFGILCFAYAAEPKFVSLAREGARLSALRELLWQSLNCDVFRRISPEDGSPYILAVAADGLRGEILQRLMAERGVLVGTGSACSSRHPFSRVVAACGLEERFLHGVLRFSFSTETTQEEVMAAAAAANDAASELISRTGR